MEARVAVLEQIAKDTRDALSGLREEMREMRTDLRSKMRDLRADQRAGFRTLLGMIFALGGLSLTIGLGLLGVMAKGFHWLN